MITLTQSDFDRIGQVAKHCNLEKLNIAIQQAVLLDLKPLLCNLFNEVAEAWDGVVDPSGISQQMYDLINGGKFVNCRGYTEEQLGLKGILAYYSYARYLMENQADDTPNGLVSKNSEWSIPKPLAEVERISDHYRNMGRQLYKSVEQYIYMNKDLFDGYCYENYACDCNGCCGLEPSNKGYGLRSKTIRKNGVREIDERFRPRLWRD